MTGRPRNFDSAEVLGRAMDLFWKNGYGATGLTELVECMGIGRQSLYSTFGDKKQLFLKALSTYLNTAYREMSEQFAEAPSAPVALEAWLGRMVIGLCSQQDGSRGCFGLNSIVELCPDHEDVVEMIQEHFERMTGLVTAQVAKGQAAGEFRDDKDAASLATFLLTGGGGLIVASKLNMPGDRSSTTATFLLECIRASKS